MTDDTNGVQKAFNAVADGTKILYVDAGTYLIADTVTIPKDAKVVGETWAQLAAFGNKFSDPKYDAAYCLQSHRNWGITDEST